MTIAGRVGYQCLAMFRKLIQSGEVEPPPGFIMNVKQRPASGSRPRKSKPSSRQKNVNRYSLDDFAEFSSDSEESVRYNNEEDEPLSPMNISEEDIILEQEVEAPRRRKKKEKIVEETEPVVYSVPVVTMHCDISWLDVCNLCGSAGSADDMLFCSECGEAFHYFCLSPPITLSPDKKKQWK
jgi:hypothetical protein